MNLYYTLLFVSLLMLYFGIKFYRYGLLAKEIVIFKIYDNPKSFYISKKGYYSVCLVGGGTINNFSISLTNKRDEKNIDFTESFPKKSFFKNGTIAITYYDFYIEKKGEYLFKVSDIDKLSVRKSLLKSKSNYQDEVSKDKISILIKEYEQPIFYIFSLLLFIIGIALFLFCSLMLLEHFGIISPK